jgi:hypothetical protein
MNSEDFQTGKLYRPNNSRDLLAIDEQQYKTNLINCIFRSEKLYSQATTFNGAFNMYVIKPNTVMLLLETKKNIVAGYPYHILKFLIEDKVLYVPLSEQRISMGYFFLLEEV